MQQMWESKGVWFWYCLGSVNAMISLVGDHISPRFSTDLSPNVETILSRLWREDTAKVVAKKTADHEIYDKELRCLFGDARL